MDSNFVQTTSKDRTWFVAILVGTFFFLGAKLGLALSTPPDYIATFWPPNTVVLAALLLTVPRRWWVYFLAMTPAYFTAAFQAGYSVQRMLIFFSANCTEILVAAVALRYFLKKDRINFGQFQEMAMFLVWAVLIAPSISAFIASIATLRELEVNYWLAWRVWFLADALGHLTFTPVIVMWGHVIASKNRQILRLRITEITILSIVIILVGYFVLGAEIGSAGNIPLLVYAPLPLLMWAAIRFGPREVCTAVFVISILSIWNAINGRGPFIERSPAENVLSLQMFLVAISVPTMLLGSILAERKQAEKELKKSEAKYHDLYENSPDMYVSVDPKTAKIMGCNQTLAHNLGYKKEEILGRHIHDMYHADSLDRARKVLKKFVKTGEVHNAELQLKRKDGSKVDVSLEVTSVRDDHGDILFSRSAWRDITEQKRTELE